MLVCVLGAEPPRLQDKPLPLGVLASENRLLPVCLSESRAAVALSVTSGFSTYVDNVSLALTWLKPDMETQL